jgi:hypothetical protein
MTETLEVVLIALVGVLLGGLLTGWFQRANTKALIEAELHKLKVQLEGVGLEFAIKRPLEAGPGCGNTIPGSSFRDWRV